MNPRDCPDPIRQGRPPQGATPLPTVTIGFAVPEEDAATIRAAAWAEGIRVATWLRRAVARELARSATK